MKTEQITVKEFAKRAGKYASTTRLMCRQNRIPGAAKPGGEWLITVPISREQFQKFVNSLEWKSQGRPKSAQSNGRRRS